jgi:hypothetical protein
MYINDDKGSVLPGSPIVLLISGHFLRQLLPRIRIAGLKYN